MIELFVITMPMIACTWSIVSALDRITTALNTFHEALAARTPSTSPASDPEGSSTSPKGGSSLP